MLTKALALVMLAATTQTGSAPKKPLVLWPDTIDATVKQAVRCERRPFGYTPAEMANFPGRVHGLDYVNRLFRDARGITEETDRVAREMLDGGYEGALKTAFAMLGANWDAGDIGPAATEITPADEASAAVWKQLPKDIHAAVEEIVRGLDAAWPHVRKSFDWDAVARRAGDSNIPKLGTMQILDLAAAPWTRFGQWCPESYAALDRFNASELATAGAIVSVSARRAIADLCQVGLDTKLPQFEACVLNTSIGTVRILGRGDNRYQGDDAVVIDLGGNDRYTGRVAVPRSLRSPVGLLIDVTGNDVYDGRSESASIACGLFGIGALFDLGGDDRYYCQDSGLGCAWHGIGLLVDTAGDDIYSGHAWCQGAAHAGVGLLDDEAGDDRYFCQMESQGLGATLGIGALVDKEGNDQYHAYDNENGRRITFPSSQTRSHEASMVQGAGYGRRADGADGRSMAGGVGVLADGAGDDSYYGGVFSQGIGFWWSCGMLADMGGNDRYRGVYFAQGGAAHFAIGSLVDRDGNDQYNDRGILGDSLGAGRDGAIGTFVDGSGDDVYYIPKQSAGGGDMNAIGLFCDQQGRDTYHPSGYSNLGGASYSSRGEYFRSRMPTIGVFVDLSGQDVYPGYGQVKNNAAWYHQSSATIWGYGLDTELNAPAAQARPAAK